MTGFHRVVAFAPPGVSAFALGIATGVFRARPGISDFDFAVCAHRTGPLPTDLGAGLTIGNGLDALDDADLVLVLPGPDTVPAVSPRLRDALRAAVARGAVVVAHCLGVFTLAAAGVLDGLEATTHWQFAGVLAEQHRAVRVRPDALFVDQGTIVTGAGAAAGMDLYLHLIRREHGATLANTIARLLVVPPHRPGGQQQYIAKPVPGGDDAHPLSDVLAWARANLDRPLTVDLLAHRALMSRRSFLRHFKATTGTSPHAWVIDQRLGLAQELLETTELPVEQIAARVGYSGAVLRERFVQRCGVAPRDYRRTFRRRALPSRLDA